MTDPVDGAPTPEDESPQPETQPEPGPDAGPSADQEAPGAAPQPAAVSQSDAKTWAMFCHLAALAFFVFPAAGNVIGPLIVWLIKRDEIPEVDREGKKSLNFQISLTIYGVVLGVPMFIPFVQCVFIPLGLALSVFGIVMVVMAAIKTNKGEPFEYPLAIELIK